MFFIGVISIEQADLGCAQINLFRYGENNFLRVPYGQRYTWKINMTLPKDNPTQFCRAYIERELRDNQERSIWMTYWPVMRRMIDRSNELKQPFAELVDKFGYSDKYEGVPPFNTYIWLVLEHIWMSIDFDKSDVGKARNEYKELLNIQTEIVDTASYLASMLRRQDELYETSGFRRSDHQFIGDLFEQASDGNYLHQTHVSPKLEALLGQYDLKYWPSRADLVEAIAIFEELQPEPVHSELPKDVIDGRSSTIKDFVLAFDKAFMNSNGLPRHFKFTNSAMADIMNVVLDLPVEHLVTGDAIRIVRHRYKN